MREREGLCLGYVLHQRPYRETSTITELFTREQGRISVVARGVRGQSRKGERRQLSAFYPFWLSWAGRGELQTLKTSEPATAPRSLSGDALFAGLYVNELLLRLCTRYDPHPAVFDNYESLIAALSEDKEVLDVPLRYFERDLLNEIGYGLNLLFDFRGNEIEPDQHYVYQPEQGAVPCGKPMMKGSVSGATLLALEAGDLCDDAQRAGARRVLRRAIGQILGGRPLKSLETLKRMKQMERSRSENGNQYG